jgi:hypothetical protein
MNRNLWIAVLVLVMIMVAGVITASNPPIFVAANPTDALQQNNSVTTPLTAVPPTNVSTQSKEKIVRLAWFYKPPDSTRMDLVVKGSDFIILTHKDEGERSEMKAKGFAAPISQYLLFLVIQDPGDCTDDPNGNQVAYKAGDFCQISEMHPDWFMLDENGNRIKSGKNYYYMDPGSEGYRAFWLERARELQESFGWDNVFIDNVEASRTKLIDTGVGLAKYADDASFQKAVEGFLAYIRQNYFEPRDKPIYANIVSVGDDKIWQRYLKYIDGAMIESFATDWGNDFRSKDDWEEQMKEADEALAMGKALILVSQGKEDDSKRQKFAFASYLLIANGNAFFRYTNYDNYRELWLYENYDLDLGMPLGDRYESKGGWRRDFEKGYVFVKPQSHTAEIVINE